MLKLPPKNIDTVKLLHHEPLCSLLLIKMTFLVQDTDQYDFLKQKKLKHGFLVWGFSVYCCTGLPLKRKFLFV